MNQFPCSHFLPKMGCLVNKASLILHLISGLQVGLSKLRSRYWKSLNSELEPAWKEAHSVVLSKDTETLHPVWLWWVSLGQQPNAHCSFLPNLFCAFPQLQDGPFRRLQSSRINLLPVSHRGISAGKLFGLKKQAFCSLGGGGFKIGAFWC